MKGFREFLMRGNVVDLAVAVVIGAAFGLVVKAFISDFITPLIGIPGGADFSAKSFDVNGSTFHYGDFINVVINFVLIAAAIYFVVVVPMARLEARRAKPSVDVATRDCPYCRSSVAKAATRCPFCTSEIPAVA